MKEVLRNIVRQTYQPLLEKYLSKERSYRYGDIELTIAPEVFHPGFFHSTKLLLNSVRHLHLEGKSLLEPGCGSGLISIYAARKKAIVTATDINPVAIEMLRTNCIKNGVDINVIHSDLFQSIPQKRFDIIAINPPYYKRQPLGPKEYAWYCGENGEYFAALFEGLGNYIHSESTVLMVLFEGCDMEMIISLARKHGFELQNIRKKKYLLETSSIYLIKKMN